MTAAVLVLLTCSPEAQKCREVRAAQTYRTIEACRAALPSTLREMNASGYHAIGRCESGQGIDPTPTGAIDDDLATVRVTRMDGGESSTSIYRVPRASP